MTLTAKQQRFIEEYPVDCNATQAAIRAGYSARTANVTGTQLLMKPSIRQAVDARLQAVTERNDITVDYVLQGLRRNYERAMEMEALYDQEGNVMEYRWAGSVANRSLELMGRWLRMWDERQGETPTLTQNNLHMHFDRLSVDELRSLLRGE